MSTAALQAAPHQSSTITSLSPASSPSSRQYPTPQHQVRDPFYNPQTSSASPAATTRRPVRRASGNGTTPTSQQHSQYNLPSVSASASGPIPSRGDPSPVHISATTAPPTSYSSGAGAEQQRGIPPIAPPRTSSNQRSSGAAHAAATAIDRSRRGDAGEERVTSSARMAATAEGADGQRGGVARQTNGNDKERRGRDEAAAAASAAARSKRRQQSAQDVPVQQGSSNAREARSRQPSSPTSGPSREASAILNRVVVSQPEVDIEREQERMAEAKLPSRQAADLTPVTGLSVVGSEGVNDGGRGGGRTRHDHSATSGKKEKNTKFGEYFLGNTLGEGEFGKVKMGWKQEGGVQVAIKLIRRDSVGTNPTRLAKIYREIAILREISHPNIVRLHEMVETDKHIGIILEYASGGELFDYILNHRYLKDNAARRLFAQLVSGVGYLHKKGIVHRDLKLENLLLDRNRNIIITDFGFANTFNPRDELGEEVEYNLSNREYVKRTELDKVLPGGFRRGDLMQTSCGSPCYAAPELVVSDSLYTGRKVDVWSCGVILYAMLAGYLPFDDDPANPEGDNINLLYKYIVSTPLTFPEYVTPHARDLLRRILVPDPRKRADLFEVARHSWLSEYAHVVGFITSSTTTTGDIAHTTVGGEDRIEAPPLARSASVREPTKAQKSPSSAIGDLSRKHGNVDQDAEDSHSKPQKDNKRRTVQVEYVAPRSQTVRGGEDAPAGASSSSKSRARSGSQGPVEVRQPSQGNGRRAVATDKPLPQEPRESAYQATNQGGRPGSNSQKQQGMPPPTRQGREPPRSVSDNTFVTPLMGQSIARPNTGGSMTSNASGRPTTSLQARGSYGQPVAPTVADTTAHGRMSQPKSGNNSGPPGSSSQHAEGGTPGYGRPGVSQVPSKFAKVAGFPDGSEVAEPKGHHKRSGTVGSISERIFGGRRGSFFGGKSSGQERGNDKSKKYPPISMPANISPGHSRQSMDSRRSSSFGFGRKRSGSIAGSGDAPSTEKPRRFSLLPASFSLKQIGIGKEGSNHGSQQDLEAQNYDETFDNREAYLETPPRNSRGQAQGREGRSTYNATNDQQYNAPNSRTLDNPTRQERREISASPVQQQQQHFPSQGQSMYDTQTYNSAYANRQRDSVNVPLQSDTSLNYGLPQQSQDPGHYSATFHDYDNVEDRRQYSAPDSRHGRGILQKNNRKFEDAYNDQGDGGYGGPVGAHNSAGSSGAARKVMDFFRRRGKDRGGV
ncbi:MAG: hypothetical protein M1818_002119 [Claussenomyces sp. TS43310]|nr:MAG: hypothetical protein M1818_002119 [Claussenomyces sp. TS43310]